MTKTPHFGHTKAGLPVHARTIDHHKGGFNKAIAVLLTARVGTMRMFWYFNVLSLLSLPATLVLVGVFAAPKSGPLHFFLTFGWIYLITWICQNYIQLVLLPALMVGQNLQNEANDARSAKQFEDTEILMDRTDTKTAGGLAEVIQEIRRSDENAAALTKALTAHVSAQVVKLSGLVASQHAEALAHGDLQHAEVKARVASAAKPQPRKPAGGD